MTPDVRGDQSTFVINITRFGLPFIIGIFYVTASLGFEFTPDSTMQMVSFVKYGFGSSSPVGYPSPLCQFLLKVGGWFRLDPLLTAKVLSLLFSCLAIFVSYLVANEILRDRLIAFCIALLLAMQGWLLQTAPSGSALSLAIALSMTALFFILRNEYIVAAFILGLCTLVFWQAVFLLGPFCLDIWINSLDKRRAIQVVVSAWLVFLSALLPWGLYAWINNVNAVPVLFRVDELPPPSIVALAVIGFLVSLGVSGFGFLLLPRETRSDVLRSNFGTVIFMAVLILSGVIFHLDVWYAALPLIAVYAFFGLAAVLKRMSSERLLYSAAFFLAGLLLVQLQFAYYRENKAAMAEAIGHANEYRMGAEWVRMNSRAGEQVCSDLPGVVEYYAERPVELLAEDHASCGDLIVTSRGDLVGYDVAFRPETVNGVSSNPMIHSAVWRRKR